MKLSIIVPCYNEQENVSLFYDATCQALGKLYENCELIFINDGSQDHTYKELNKLFEKDKEHIKVINFSRNFGKESALLAGLKNSQGEFVTIIDADLQQRPEYIIEMIKFLNEHHDYDCVAAYQDIRKEGLILSFFKNCFYKIINKMTEIEIVRSASDFRTLRRNVVEAIISLPERCRFSKGIFSWVGFNTYYMPYTVEERANGISKWSFWKLFTYAIDGITAFSTTPLIVASGLGIFFCLLAFLFIMIIIVKTIVWGEPVAGFPTLATLILLSSGIQLLFIGILGQYLAKSYTESKHRPMYIIKEILNNREEHINE